MKLPKVRTNDLIEQEAGGELLVYDLRTNSAYVLNETSKNVFEACDGETSFEDLKRRYKYTDDVIYLALDELKKNDLMEEDYSSPFSGINRRAAIRKVGLSTMIALPLISNLIAPKAAHAASPGAVAACSSVGSPCFCQNGDTNSCGTGRVIFNGAAVCPSGCTCFTPGTCSTAGIGCGGSCG